jgi:hypothetical protein
MSLIFTFYGGCLFASLHLYISIAKRPSLTILPDVHMYKAVSSEIEVYFSYLDRIGLLKIVFV